MAGEIPASPPQWFLDLSAPYFPEPGMLKDDWIREQLRMFENKYVASIELLGLPSYFRVIGWLDNDRLLGINGDRPVIYQISSGEVEIIEQLVWGLALAPNGKKFAYNNGASISGRWFI